MDKKIKILAAYHKKDRLFEDNIITPIHLGREIVCKKDNKSENDIWMLNNMIGDNIGDNISIKNPYYNEMTALYWAWKNYESLGNPDYIGLIHYRRHFMITDSSKPIYESVFMPSDYINTFLNYSPENLEHILCEYDFIAPLPQAPAFGKTVFEHYRDSHKIADLERALILIEQKYPNMLSAAKEYLYNKKAYYYNMFIMKKEFFLTYAEFVFDILRYFEEDAINNNRRLYLNERLTGIYITYLEEKGLRGKYLPVSYLKGITEIPVVFAIDENYMKPLYVAINSIMQHASVGYYYKFFIMIPDSFGLDNQNILNELCELYNNCSISYVDMGNAFENIHMRINHITSPTYYRLLVTEYLPNINKCIYLDPDILVCDDLAKVFSINVDDYYIGAVKAAWYHSQLDGARGYSNRNGLPSMTSYVNAGVLVLNLKRMRNDHICEKFIEILNNPFASQDQDIINIVCYGKIRFMPLKYNAMTKYIAWSSEEYQNIYSKEEFKEAWEHPIIIHYADKMKPWNGFDGPLDRLWWEALSKTSVWKDVCDEKKEIIYKRLYNVKKDQREIDQLKKVINGFVHSPSYRIGRAVTFLPRKFIGGIKCIKYKGWGYTLKYAVKKAIGRV